MMSIQNENGVIICNEGAWQAFETQLDSLNASSIFILVDNNTKKYCLPVFLDALVKPFPYTVVEMPSGEKHKNIATCTTLWQQLSDLGADRASVLINLGGGVVTDLGGFVAATFKRGIQFINIPTSLLAMVDASVGGKNGVDLGGLKNQIGLIQPPSAVIIDTRFLNTLSKAEMISGYAEMLKHGLIHSEAYWDDVQTFLTDTDAEKARLIWESVLIKNAVVTQDPTEQNLRKTLNYGHTLGHAIETYCLETDHKTTLLHGEAVAIGMILATYISSELLGFPKKKLAQISNIICTHYSKSDFDSEAIKTIIELLKFDKKNRNGHVNFVLLKDFGQHEINQSVSNELIYRAFKFYEEL